MSEQVTPRVNVGGQAVIEGVMMMTKTKIATAVRKESGKIILNVDDFSSKVNINRFTKLPFIRGVISLFEMLYIGMRTLLWSVNQQESVGGELSVKEITGTIAVSLIASLIIFVGVPYALTYVITQQQNTLFHLIDGGFRLFIFVVYLLIIGKMSDIARVFQYHGAEHKAVNCFELQKELTVKNVLECSRIHPRCGTSLIVFVLGLSILLFALLNSQVWYVNVLYRVLLIPVIAGIAYEIVKFSAKHDKNMFLRAIIKPGPLTQQLTTREPDKHQCEVAIAALKAAL